MRMVGKADGLLLEAAEALVIDLKVNVNLNGHLLISRIYPSYLSIELISMKLTRADFQLFNGFCQKIVIKGFINQKQIENLRFLFFRVLLWQGVSLSKCLTHITPQIMVEREAAQRKCLTHITPQIMVEREAAQRKCLSKLSTEFLEFELVPDEKRVCRVCNTTMYLSAVVCSCHPGSKLVVTQIVGGQ